MPLVCGYQDTQALNSGVALFQEQKTASKSPMAYNTFSLKPFRAHFISQNNITITFIEVTTNTTKLFFLIVAGAQNRRTAIGLAMELFEQHQGTHILQVNTNIL